MGQIVIRSVAILTLGAVLSGNAFAGRETNPFSGPGFHPRGTWSGFENREAELGAAVSKVIKAEGAPGVKDHDFTGREKQLGHGVATLIRTINTDSPYQHEINDALVKMTLNYIQFARDQGLMPQMLEHELKVQMPMLNANRKRVADTGDLEVALMTVTERTACFYQLVTEVQRAPGEIRYKSPYGTVLAMTRQMGQHTLTEKEIHEIYTIPRLKMQGEKLGVNFEVSPWQDDGWITIRVKPVKVAAAR